MSRPAAREDIAWIEDTIASLKPLEPVTPSVEHVRVREAWVRQRVASVQPGRLPGLIVALFDVYEARKSDSFSELMWTIEALYRALPQRIAPTEACAILEATRHSCGHGGVCQPIVLARRAFSDEPYTPEFFDAVRAYRNALTRFRSAEARRTLGEIAFILWEDVREPLKPRSCLSSAVREGLASLPTGRRAAWSQLLRHVDRTAKRRPDRRWEKAAVVSLEAVGREGFATDLRAWLGFPDGKVTLSTGGRHVLKTLIWFAALSEADALDEQIPRFIDLDYAKPVAAVHLIYAVGYWLETRPPAFATLHRERLRSKWPIAGARIRD